MLNKEKHSKELLNKFKALSPELDNIPYLNGGLFSPKEIETKNGDVQISDSVWGHVFTLLNGYEWVIEEEKGDSTTLTPSILGHIYEKSVIAATQKETGSYYTPEEITTYISKNTIYPYIRDKVNEKFGTKYKNIWNELLNKIQHTKEEIEQVRFIYFDVLKNLKICDNACGSGAFLIAAQQILVPIYWACIKALQDKPFFREEWNEIRKYKRIGYYIKRTIITKNLYGVDIQEGAVEIAKLRLWLSMVSEMELKAEDIEPLPNIDYNLLAGNSLIGYIQPEEIEVSKGTFLEESKPKGQQKLVKEKLKQLKFVTGKSVTEIMKARQHLIDAYREEKVSGTAEIIKKDIERISRALREDLNKKLYQKFQEQGIKISWEEFLKLKPFHWGFEFYDVFNGHKSDEEKGFDIIIGNPPWNAVKPVEKEFFSDYDPRLTKYGVDKIEARKIIKELLKKRKIRRKIREGWEKYKAIMKSEMEYYKKGGVYKYQSDEIDGKKVGGDLNYYKIFLERTYQLMVSKGYLGYIVPSGFHTDAGTKGLRRLFFDNGKIVSICNFENRKGIFQGIHKSFKFDLVIFQKSGKTGAFYGAFMLHDVGILKQMPKKALLLDWNLIKKLSPDSFSVIEFKTQKDIEITKKLSQHPMLKENNWLGKVELFRELDMTLDSHLFNTKGKGLILYEGKMIEQYTPYFEKNRYWVEETKGKNKLYERNERKNFDYKYYRLGFRAVASSTNRRSMIASLLPKNVFCGNSIIVLKLFDEKDNRNISEDKLIYLCAVFNSFVFDYLLRLKITTNLNMFFIYQMPIPIPQKESFERVVNNVLLLTEDWQDFEELRNKYGINRKKLSKKDRLKIMANIDKIIGNLYGLTHEDMSYILSKFHHAEPNIENDLRTLEKFILSNYEGNRENQKP